MMSFVVDFFQEPSNRASVLGKDSVFFNMVFCMSIRTFRTKNTTYTALKGTHNMSRYIVLKLKLFTTHNNLDISTPVLKDTRRDHTKVVCPNTAHLPDESEPCRDEHKRSSASVTNQGERLMPPNLTLCRLYNGDSYLVLL